MAGEFSLIGTEKLIKTIKAVNHDVVFKSGRFALRKAANLVAASLKVGAAKLDDPETARSIADNVAVRFASKSSKNGNIVFRVGVRGGAVLSKGGAKTSGSPTPHWRLLEFGTEKMAARPFFRQALEGNINQATAEFISQFQKSLDRAVKKAKIEAGAL